MWHCCVLRRVEQLTERGSGTLYRYLMGNSDRDIKLVLEAFQMSVGQALAYPHVPGLLRCLMAGRLMSVPLSRRMEVRWHSCE